MCTLAASFATGQVIKLADGKKYNYGEGGYCTDGSSKVRGSSTTYYPLSKVKDFGAGMKVTPGVF